MKTWQIILSLAIFFTNCQFIRSQQPAPVASPYPAGGTQPVVIGRPYLRQQQMIQPAQQPAAVYPPQSPLIPLPSQTPGSIFGPPAPPPVAGQPMAGPPPGAVEPLPNPPGAVVGPLPSPPGAPPVVPGPPNPIMVPVADETYAWDQIADVVDDYFKITREQRVRRTGEAWTEGRIETASLDGATVLEPHRHDSVGWFNRWESTFQSIRRRAIVRVIPDPNGYLVEVVVLKELEDLPKPEKGTVGPSTFGSELTLPSQRLEEVVRTHPSPKWIPMGRDPALEQRMLSDIHARLNGITTQRSVFGD
jgi:hypothetical protein